MKPLSQFVQSEMRIHLTSQMFCKSPLRKPRSIAFIISAGNLANSLCYDLPHIQVCGRKPTYRRSNKERGCWCHKLAKARHQKVNYHYWKSQITLSSKRVIVLYQDPPYFKTEYYSISSRIVLAKPPEFRAWARFRGTPSMPNFFV